MTQVILSVKQKQTHRRGEKICGHQREGQAGTNWVGSLELTDASHHIENRGVTRP